MDFIAIPLIFNEFQWKFVKFHQFSIKFNKFPINFNKFRQGFNELSPQALVGPYRFTGKPFGHLQIHWQALLVVFWDHYRFTGKLQGVQNQPTKGIFFWIFFRNFWSPGKQFWHHECRAWGSQPLPHSYTPPIPTYLHDLQTFAHHHMLLAPLP